MSTSSQSHSRQPSTNPNPPPSPQKSHKPRPSSTIAASQPKPPVRIHPSAIVSEKAQLNGTHAITIGANAVIHPFARIQSMHGPVEIGESAIVWERGVVGVSAGDEGSGDTSAAVSARSSMGGTATVLERQAVVEAHAVVEHGAYVGHNTTVEVGARVGTGAVVGEFCKITPRMVVDAFERVDGYTTLFMGLEGRSSRRSNATIRDNETVKDVVEKGHEAHIELLKKLVKSNVSKWQS